MMCSLRGSRSLWCPHFGTQNDPLSTLNPSIMTLTHQLHNLHSLLLSQARKTAQSRRKVACGAQKRSDWSLWVKFSAPIAGTHNLEPLISQCHKSAAFHRKICSVNSQIDDFPAVKTTPTATAMTGRAELTLKNAYKKEFSAGKSPAIGSWGSITWKCGLFRRKRHFFPKKTSILFTYLGNSRSNQQLLWFMSLFYE